MPTLYAAYGSNLHPARLGERLPAAELLGTARLEGWSLAFHKRGRDGSGKCSIRPGGSGVGLAVFALSRRDLGALDAIEGVGAGYERRVIELPRYGACHTYVAETAHVDDGLAPFDWYLELVILGAEHHGFDGGYIERLATVAATGDPDPRRHAEHWELIRRIDPARRPAGRDVP
jgi:hypothetical protein